MKTINWAKGDRRQATGNRQITFRPSPYARRLDGTTPWFGT